MKKILCGLVLTFAFLLFLSFRSTELKINDQTLIDSLRKLYSGPKNKWPKPNVDASIKFEELGSIPPSPIDLKNDSIKKIVNLGRVLFFDPRLSVSNQISCSSCHAPDLNWADGREKSIGHNHTENKRNSPSLENVWFFKRLFWDGRSESLEDQAQNPISSNAEMHQDMKLLPKKLQKIKDYQNLFLSAFGDKKVTNKRVFKALADFQRTIISGKTDFDRFLEGNKNSLTDQQVLGLHLFRTKARCVNCHNGPLFTDNDFHNVGLTYYGKKNEDLGLYNVTKKPEDVGKFKTPGLRNVMRTSPWFHNGLFPDMDKIMDLYNMGMPVQSIKPEQVNDPLFPKNDKLLRGIRLSKTEKDAVISFLHSLSSIPWKESQLELPD